MADPWLSCGWQVFPAEPAVSAWCDAVRPDALSRVAEPRMRRTWLRHGGTWFAGVDLLPNDDQGRIAAGPALTGAARAAAEAAMGHLPLHAAQVSVTYPGYPARDAEESEAAHRYRRLRDAAHLDGLLPEGPARRRHLREPHGYILGIALTEADAGAAPLVVYDGSHQILRAAFQALFAGHDPEAWGDIDATDAYQAARRDCFATCQRREVPLKKGEAVLLHRMTLHGVAPWQAGAGADPAGRAIAYFRPQLPHIADWLNRD